MFEEMITDCSIFQLGFGFVYSVVFFYSCRKHGCWLDVIYEIREGIAVLLSVKHIERRIGNGCFNGITTLYTIVSHHLKYFVVVILSLKFIYIVVR